MQHSLVRSEEGTSSERVTTGLELSGSPDAVWRCLMFYEDVPRRPWPLLRFVLPQPRFSQGDKLSVGSPIRCVYDRGYLVKRITHVEPMRFLGFEVLEQRLGIERYGVASRGSYELETVARGTRVVLTTSYLGKLRPRFVFRWFERYLCHRLHRHILLGMSERLQSEAERPSALTSGVGRGADTAAAPSR